MPKKLTEQEISDITEWFLHEYWPTYPGKWCRGGKGSRQTCLTMMLEKIQPDESERRRILGNLKAQILHDRKIPDGQRKWWKMCDTYTRNRLWEDEIEPISEPLKTELAKCVCGMDVIGPRFDECEHCFHKSHDQWKGQRITSLKTLGLLKEGDNYGSVIQKCKELCMVNGQFSLNHLFKMVKQ